MPTTADPALSPDPAGRSRGVLLLALAVLLAGCTTTSSAEAPPSSGDAEQQLVAAVSGAGAVAHLEQLQRIADANGGNRAAPGPGYDASVDYVAGVLRDAGYDVSTPTYPAPVDDREDGPPVMTRQVIAQTRTGDPQRVVMAGAHLDSVPDGPGINDNGSGVATLLEIATRLGGSPQVAQAVRFGFWGSEEIDLNGSTSYVESLSGPERQRIAAYLNVDMVASPNAGYYVQGGAGRRPSQTGPPGSAGVVRVLSDQLARTGAVAEVVPFDGESDYVAFIEAGIPSGSMYAGDDDEKSPREARSWGGRAGAPFDPCYHRACDRVDDLDRTALDRNTDAVAGALAHFATSLDPIPD
jgi:aminopeptidase S